MKKIISAIIGIPAFFVFVSETDDINVMLTKTLITGSILLFICYINGAFQENESSER